MSILSASPPLATIIIAHSPLSSLPAKVTRSEPGEKEPPFTSRATITPFCLMLTRRLVESWTPSGTLKMALKDHWPVVVVAGLTTPGVVDMALRLMALSELGKTLGALLPMPRAKAEKWSVFPQMYSPFGQGWVVMSCQLPPVVIWWKM